MVILFQFIDGRSGNTVVIKVKSHLEDVGPTAIKQNKIAFQHRSCGRGGGETFAVRHESGT